MTQLRKYLNIGIVGLMLGFTYCTDTTEEQKLRKDPPIVEVIKNVQTRQEVKIEYVRTGGKLRSSLNQFVEPYTANCIIRYSGSLPGNMVTCIYDKGRRISVQFTNERRETSTLDDFVESTVIQEYKLRYEKDRALLKKAGIY